MKSLKFTIIASFLSISAQSYTFSSNLYDIEPEKLEVQSSLCQLPNELKESIFSHLTAKDFIRLSHTSREWRQLSYFAGRNKSIDLSDRKLTNEDCQALMQAPFSSIILRFCKLRRNNVAIFFQSNGVDKLVSEINPEGISVLDANKFRAIRRLDLSDNRLGFSNLSYLADAWLPFLESLNLSDNLIGPEKIKYLAKAHLPALTSLDLTGNELESEGIKHLVTASFIPNLTSLILVGNFIATKGAKYMVSERFPRLKSLNLFANHIGVNGIKYLMSEFPDPIKLELDSLTDSEISESE